MNNGKLIVFSAPSGGGKSTIIRMVMEKFPNLKYSVSATTREKRGNEVHGVSYYFLTRNEFENRIEEDDFIEYKTVYDNLYGTPKSAIKEAISNGDNIVLDIDVQGAKAVKNCMGESSLFIFITPPDLDTLRSRLILRNEDKPEIIEKRLQFAKNEISQSDWYDYIVVNDKLDRAVDEIIDILIKENIITYEGIDGRKKI
ncbi:MAG: guanylate kinase [Candidatus Delongbacteria bacterium]|nr:guanylate kinase [Candidatus Delongbacteria bacterium]MBN2836339.1 guanylate kinase [Candidatus Delongbacteria bacterium]